MSPLVHGDVTAAARVLLSVPAASREALAVRLLREAACADAHRLSTGRAHPVWGNGTLMSAALAHGPAPEPALDDQDYLSCLGSVIDALLGQRARASPMAVGPPHPGRAA